MLADDAVMEFPYAPPGLPARREGRAAIGEYLGALSRHLAFGQMSGLTTYPTTDPDIVVFEFAAAGQGVASGAAYEQRYISVVTTRAGRIVFYRDYWHPLAILKALKGPALAEATKLEGIIGG